MPQKSIKPIKKKKSQKPSKGQHSVPACYLRNFGGPDGSLWVYDKVKFKNRISNADAVEIENDHLTLENVTCDPYLIETELSKIERIFATCLYEINASLDFLDAGNMNYIYNFVALFFAKTFGQRHKIEHAFESWLLAATNDALRGEPLFFASSKACRHSIVSQSKGRLPRNEELIRW